MALIARAPFGSLLLVVPIAPGSVLATGVLAPRIAKRAITEKTMMLRMRIVGQSAINTASTSWFCPEMSHVGETHVRAGSNGDLIHGA